MIPALLINKCSGRLDARNFSAKESIEAGFIMSKTSISTLAIPSRFFRALFTSLAGTITVAPAAASVFVVSKPIPVLPPVTIAILPVRSMPLITSVVVDLALKPEPSGC
ncbi:hypothetical protein D3C72_1698240 [compost metagenome]